MATAEVAPCEDCRFSMLFNYRICLSYGHYMVVIPSRIICGLSSNWKQGACVLNSIFYQKFWGILLMSNVQFLLSSTWLAFKILFSFFITAVGIFVYFPCTWVAPLCTLFIYKERKKKKGYFSGFSTNDIPDNVDVLNCLQYTPWAGLYWLEVHASVLLRLLVYFLIHRWFDHNRSRVLSVLYLAWLKMIGTWEMSFAWMFTVNLLRWALVSST